MYKYGLATNDTTLHRNPLSHAAKRDAASIRAVDPVAARGVVCERGRRVADAPTVDRAQAFDQPLPKKIPESVTPSRRVPLGEPLQA